MPAKRTPAQRRADIKLAIKRVTWSVAINSESQPEHAKKLTEIKDSGNLNQLFMNWLMNL